MGCLKSKFIHCLVYLIHKQWTIYMQSVLLISLELISSLTPSNELFSFEDYSPNSYIVTLEKFIFFSYQFFFNSSDEMLNIFQSSCQNRDREYET